MCGGLATCDTPFEVAPCQQLCQLGSARLPAQPPTYMAFNQLTAAAHPASDVCTLLYLRVAHLPRLPAPCPAPLHPGRPNWRAIWAYLGGLLDHKTDMPIAFT